MTATLAIFIALCLFFECFAATKLSLLKAYMKKFVFMFDIYYDGFINEPDLCKDAVAELNVEHTFVVDLQKLFFCELTISWLHVRGLSNEPLRTQMDILKAETFSSFGQIVASFTKRFGETFFGLQTNQLVPVYVDVVHNAHLINVEQISLIYIGTPRVIKTFEGILDLKPFLRFDPTANPYLYYKCIWVNGQMSCNGVALPKGLGYQTAYKHLLATEFSGDVQQIDVDDEYPVTCKSEALVLGALVYSSFEKFLTCSYKWMWAESLRRGYNERFPVLTPSMVSVYLLSEVLKEVVLNPDEDVDFWDPVQMDICDPNYLVDGEVHILADFKLHSQSFWLLKLLFGQIAGVIDVGTASVDYPEMLSCTCGEERLITCVSARDDLNIADGSDDGEDADMTGLLGKRIRNEFSVPDKIPKHHHIIQRNLVEAH